VVTSWYRFVGGVGCFSRVASVGYMGRDWVVRLAEQELSRAHCMSCPWGAAPPRGSMNPFPISHLRLHAEVMRGESASVAPEGNAHLYKSMMPDQLGVPWTRIHLSGCSPNNCYGLAPLSRGERAVL